jgi:hypothetical protein
LYSDAEAACEHFAALAEKQDEHQDEIIDNGTAEFVTKIRYEPYGMHCLDIIKYVLDSYFIIGVIGAITPWNYPFLM